MFSCTNDGILLCIIVLPDSQTASHYRPPDNLRVCNGKLSLSFLNQNLCCGYLNGPIK